MALRRRHVSIGIGVCLLLIAACTGSNPDYPLGQHQWTHTTLLWQHQTLLLSGEAMR